MATQTLMPPVQHALPGKLWSSCLIVLFLALALVPLALVGR